MSTRKFPAKISCIFFVLYSLCYRSFSSDVTAAILVYQNNEMAAILVYGTGISSFLFKYFVLFHHPTGATDHVSENDLYWENSKLCKNTPPSRRRVSTQFLVFPIFTRVDITVYQHGKCFIFLKYKAFLVFQRVLTLGGGYAPTRDCTP